MIEKDRRSDHGLICAFRLDGRGGGVSLEWDDLQIPLKPEGVTWIHLDLTAPETATFGTAELPPLSEAAETPAEHSLTLVSTERGRPLEAAGNRR